MPKVLSEAQIRRFEDEGYLAPIAAMSERVMAGYLGRLERFEVEHPEETGKLYQGPLLSGKIQTMTV